MRRVAAVLLLTFVVLLAAGCSGKVTGQVSSKSAQKPVSAATVVVGDQKAVTDTSGNFTIDKVSTGAAGVAVQADGFGSYKDTLDVQRGSNSLNVVLEDGTVRGVLRENAAVTEPIKKTKVIVAGEKVKLEGNRFVATGVPIGEQTITVTAPGHEPYKDAVEVVPGDNALKVSLNLTPTETYMRYYQAYRFNRMREAYRFLHDDVKKHDSFKHFTKDMGDGSDIAGIKLFDPRSMSKWRCSWAKKTYKHIVAIDRALRVQTGYGGYSDNLTQHWQQIAGRWYIIYDWRN